MIHIDVKLYAIQMKLSLKNCVGTSLVADGKASACKAGDLGSIPGLGKSPGEGNGSPLQQSCLENLMDGGTWQATVHGVAKSWTQLSHSASFLSIFKILGLVFKVVVRRQCGSIMLSNKNKLSLVVHLLRDSLISLCNIHQAEIMCS